MGYLSEVERKQRLIDVFNGFTFEYTRDFSDEILVHTPNDYSDSELLSAVSQLIWFFMLNTHTKLRDFSGFDNINFKIINNE